MLVVGVAVVAACMLWLVGWLPGVLVPSFAASFPSLFLLYLYTGWPCHVWLGIPFLDLWLVFGASLSLQGLFDLFLGFLTLIMFSHCHLHGSTS